MELEAKEESRSFHLSPTLNGYLSHDDCKFPENGEIFFCYLSRECDVDWIWVFGMESDLDGLVKYKHWACDGTFKCSPDVYHQLYTLHVFIDKI